MRSAIVGVTDRTTEFKSRLYEDDFRSYTESVRITLANNTVLDLTEEKLWGGGIEIDDAVSADNTLDVGSAIIGACTITIENLDGAYSQYEFLKAKVIPSVNLRLANNSIATVKLGEYYVEDESFDASCVKLTCYDAMAKFDKLISASSLAYPATLNNILSNACTVCGVSLASSVSLPHGTYTVQNKPDDTTTTFRELIAWTGQINGRNARINTNGQLEFIWYDKSTLDDIIDDGLDANTDHTIQSTFGAPTVSLNDITVTQVNVNQKVIDAETGNESIVQYTNGVSGYTISIENNDLIQGDINGTASGSVISGWLYQQLNGFTFRRASFSCLSDPLIEAGDVAKLIDRNDNVYAIIISGSKFKVGSQQTIRSSAAEPERTSASRMGQATKNYVNTMLSLAEERAERANSVNTVMQTMVADYATISALNTESARITNLSTDYASFKDATTDSLNANTAHIAQLQTGKADIGDLNTATANIGVLNTKVATINTLLNGNQATENLQAITLTADVATIDAATINLATLKSLLATNITVGDLLAGRISTNDFTVGSDDGAFNITGATLAIKDGEGHTRIQIGKDGQGNFTFTLFDEDGQGILINETGVQDADAIADGLISNVHVANNAAIAGTKLDIASVFEAMNGSSSTLNATHIYLDEGSQTLTQAYSQLSTNITNVSSAAQTANDNANRAMRAIEGISSLDNLTAILSNDAHVVHTLTDGSSGDYTDAKTQVYVYRGDTDVTNYSIVIVNPSSSVTGTWNDTTKTYQITGLSADNGYVDFDVSYGVNTSYLLMPDDKRLVMPDGNALKLPIAAHVYKRFSISKSRDGRVGISYKIQSSIGIIRRTRDGSLNPSTVTFSAKYSDGSGLFNYSGKYVIAESQDGNTWTTAYESEDVEASKTFTPTSGTRFIRATLLNEEDVQLDIQTITIIADADELATDLQAAETAIVSVTERVGTVETGINGLSVNLQEMETQIQGVGDRNLVYTTPYTIDGDDVTFNARVYRNGNLVTTEYPEEWFSWLRRTEDGDEKLGIGYTLQTQKSLMGIGGGVIIGRFETFDDSALVLPNNNGVYLIMPDENRLTLYTAS